VRVGEDVVSFAVNSFATGGVSRRRGGDRREVEGINRLRLTRRIIG
jgi:hypothetical protein